MEQKEGNHGDRYHHHSAWKFVCPWVRTTRRCYRHRNAVSGFLRFSYQYDYDADCGDCDLSSDFESGRSAENRRRGDAERGKIPQKKELKAREQVEKEKIHQYQFTGKPETKRLYKGDQILVPAKQGKGNIVLTVGGTLGNFSILTPSGNQIVELSEERDIDIDGDGFADLIIYLSDVSNGAGAINGMFDMQPSVGVMSNLRAINSSMNDRQNGNSELLSAVKGLRKDFANSNGGVTVDVHLDYNAGSDANEIANDIATSLRRAIRRGV